MGQKGQKIYIKDEKIDAEEVIVAIVGSVSSANLRKTEKLIGEKTLGC